VPEQAEAPNEELEVPGAEPEVDPFDNDLQSIVDGLKPAEQEEPSEEDAPAAPELGSDEWWEQEIAIPGSDETATLRSLLDDRLRQADYTRKTQELAADKQVLRDAVEFLDAFKQDPQGFAQALAEQAGIVEAGAVPAREIEQAKIQTEAEIEAEVSRRLEEAIGNDPRIQQALIANSQFKVDQAFATIEDQFGVTLNKDSRDAILDEAAERGVGDLTLVFEAMVARAAPQGRAKRAAPKRPGSPAPSTDKSEPAVVADVDEAWDRAVAELNG
jgi:hypothetical protein